MPANVESAFTVRRPAWWDREREHVHDRHPADWDEAREWAGLTWEPIEVPLLVPSTGGRFEVRDRHPANDLPEPWDDLSDDARRALLTSADISTTNKQIVRDDNLLRLAVVGIDFGLVTHQRMGEIMNALLDRSDVVYETAGVLGIGGKVWALARVDAPYEIKRYDTPVYPYCALLNAHDGSAALKAINTSVCIVCQNTWHAAEGQAEAEGRSFTFRHTRKIDERIEAARDIVLGARRDTERWIRRGEVLVRVPMSEAQTESFITDFTAPKVAESMISDRAMRNVERAREQIREIVHGPTVQGVGVAGTVFGCVAAAGEYLDHVRRYRSRDSYVSRTLLRTEPAKAKAERLALEIVTEGMTDPQSDRLTRELALVDA